MFFPLDKLSRIRRRLHFPTGGVLVGGAVRDLLYGHRRLGQSPKDFDWLVPDPKQAAQDYLKWCQQCSSECNNNEHATHEGAVFCLDDERNYWRVKCPNGVQHDFVPFVPLDNIDSSNTDLSAHLSAELLRRDFSVNAMALAERGQLIDPSNGLADLRAKRLRMISAANLWADPLRVWRAARLAAKLGFELEPQTRASVQEIAAALATRRLAFPAMERIRDEMTQLLMLPNAAHGLLLLDELGLLALTLPEFCEGKNVQQGGFHHLDVFHHGLEALHQLLARVPDAAPSLRWATLLHDVGKPLAQRQQCQHAQAEGTETKHQTRRFYKHDEIGAKLAQKRLTALKLSAQEAKHIAALVAAHMRPLPQNPQEARRFVHRLRPLLPDLLWLMLADREAARGPQSSHASRERYTRAFDLVVQALEVQPKPPKPLLNGHEIMQLLQLEGGPKLGQAVRALAEAQALEQVMTEQEARQWLLRWQQRR